ncbi:hypothetical protein [Streptomyces flavofungini]|uniref:hypothetical protein n=1 Tax=Streptomyces flavofungini TaxID=68200 RepID=UPI0025B112E6|nr:hypothetical protein [Streptomyces flavofungini]WJV49160.1 hypothetical protein QUY26_28820 [Streptomyces flavofungini]
MTPKSPTTRASQLALLLALLFGIVAMHSLGHPREHGASAERAIAGGAAGVAADGGHARGESRVVHARGESGSGHARGESGGGHARGVMAKSPAYVSPTVTTPAGVSPTTVRHAAAAAPNSTGPEVLGPAAGGPTGGHDSGMDPLSVCLAVLGAALTLVLLRAAVRHRLWGAPAYVPGRARLLDALRPNPPPPRALLTRLSVLRV